MEQSLSGRHLVEYGSSHGRWQPRGDHAVVQGGVTALQRLHAKRKSMVEV